MKGITVVDSDPSTGLLAFDLRHLLRLLGADVARSIWTVKGVECLGAQAADALHEASENGEELKGGDFVDIAERVTQIIDGEFSARLPDDGKCWIIIRAIDSSAYDILTDREDVLTTLKAHFTNVKELPEI